MAIDTFIGGNTITIQFEVKDEDHNLIDLDDDLGELTIYDKNYIEIASQDTIMKISTGKYKFEYNTTEVINNTTFYWEVKGQVDSDVVVKRGTFILTFK